ncbi:MAG: hypothetical protein IJT77_14930 [Clostridia bacterium]|nr:hypothetical protein [Clostridia bacterium]
MKSLSDDSLVDELAKGRPVELVRGQWINRCAAAQHSGQAHVRTVNRMLRRTAWMGVCEAAPCPADDPST